MMTKPDTSKITPLPLNCANSAIDNIKNAHKNSKNPILDKIKDVTHDHTFLKRTFRKNNTKINAHKYHAIVCQNIFEKDGNKGSLDLKNSKFKNFYDIHNYFENSAYHKEFTDFYLMTTEQFADSWGNNSGREPFGLGFREFVAAGVEILFEEFLEGGLGVSAQNFLNFERQNYRETEIPEKFTTIGGFLNDTLQVCETLKAIMIKNYGLNLKFRPFATIGFKIYFARLYIKDALEIGLAPPQSSTSKYEKKLAELEKENAQINMNTLGIVERLAEAKLKIRDDAIRITTLEKENLIKNQLLAKKQEEIEKRDKALDSLAARYDGLQREQVRVHEKEMHTRSQIEFWKDEKEELECRIKIMGDEILSRDERVLEAGRSEDTYRRKHDARCQEVGELKASNNALQQEMTDLRLAIQTALGKENAPSGQPSATLGHASAPLGQTSAPSGKTSAPSGHVSAPSGQVSAPSGQASAPSGQATAPQAAQTQEAAKDIAVGPPKIRPGLDKAKSWVLINEQNRNLVREPQKAKLIDYNQHYKYDFEGIEEYLESEGQGSVEVDDLLTIHKNTPKNFFEQFFSKNNRQFNEIANELQGSATFQLFPPPNVVGGIIGMKLGPHNIQTLRQHPDTNLIHILSYDDRIVASLTHPSAAIRLLKFLVDICRDFGPKAKNDKFRNANLIATRIEKLYGRELD